MSDKRFSQLCIKEVSGNINETEKKILDDWLNKSEQNRKEFEQIKNIWSKISVDEIPLATDIDVEWFALYNRLQKESVSKKKHSFRRPALRPVLIGALGILLLFLSIYIVNREVPIQQLKIVTTLNKEHKEVRLPDGSIVLLNGGSQIKFLENFDENTREISLKGEAFFSVNKDGRSFIVKTDNAKTVVLGTKFNVRSSLSKTEVFVKEGKVSLQQNKLDDKKVVLIKNQFSFVNNNQPPTSPEEMDPYILSWIEGRIEFNQTRLTEIVGELERFYNIPVVLEKHNELKDYTLTGSFNKQGIDSILIMICTALNLNLEKHNEGYLIKPKSIN